VRCGPYDPLLTSNTNRFVGRGLRERRRHIPLPLESLLVKT
jgi:hypothetical protein